MIKKMLYQGLICTFPNLTTRYVRRNEDYYMLTLKSSYIKHKTNIYSFFKKAAAITGAVVITACSFSACTPFGGSASIAKLRQFVRQNTLFYCCVSSDNKQLFSLSPPHKNIKKVLLQQSAPTHEISLPYSLPENNREPAVPIFSQMINPNSIL